MKNQYRALALVVLAAALVLLELTKGTVLTEDAPEKRAASQRAAACYEAIYAEKLSRGLEMDAGADINRTGMIGLDYSFITTTVGNLEAKRTSTNPNMAAVVVDMKFIQMDRTLALVVPVIKASVSSVFRLNSKEENNG